MKCLRNLLAAGIIAFGGIVGGGGSAQAAINPPTGVTATALSNASIRVQWIDNSTDESGFRVYMANNPSATYIEVGEVAANATEFVMDGLPPSTQRFFRVLAFKDSVYIPEDISNITASATATTQANNQAPVAVDDTANVTVGQTAVGNVLANDTDPNGNVLAVVQPNADIAADGSFSIPTSAVGSVVYDYTVTDGTLTDAGQLTVTADNQLPVVQNETVTVVVGEPATGNVLANDSDPDGHSLTATSSEMTVGLDGEFSIPTTIAGSTDYDYFVSDGFGVDVMGTLTVVVTNEAPVVQDEEVTVTVGQTAQGNVLANDSDPDGHDIAVVQPNPDIAADGSFSIPTTVVGSEEYEYEVSDGFGGVTAGTLTVTAEAIPNTGPTAVDDTASGMATSTPSGNVLTNDTDPEGNPLTVASSSGSVTINPDGSWSFPPPHAAGTYITDYIVTDGQLNDTGRLTVTITAPPVQGLLAFPGADGAGRFAVGGRGGYQCFVTNLNDSGPGSFRACAEASGPRTVIFRVSGYIECGPTSIDIHDPFITIAGQTAPGQGIAFRNCGIERRTQIVRIYAHDVIMQHLRFRAGNPSHTNAGSSNGDNIIVGGGGQTDPIYNLMFDHMSLSWATDENIDISPTGNASAASPVSRITIQDSLIYEGLHQHSKGPNYRSCGVSTIRSLIASNQIRNPNNTCGKQPALGSPNVRGGGGVTGENEFRNNVVYNGQQAFFDMWDGRGEAWVNIVGNVFKKGPNSQNKLNNNFAFNIYPVDAWNLDRNQQTCAGNCPSDADPLHIYLNDNLAIGFGTNPGGAPVQGVLNPNDAHLVSPSPVGDGVFEDGVLGQAMPSSQVQSYIAANAGAFPNNRDTADQRIVNDMLNGTGSIPTCTSGSTSATCDLFPESNYPTLSGGTPYPDADNDGMDDNWEASNGVSQPNADADGDGYTNLEEFLHFRASQV